MLKGVVVSGGGGGGTTGAQKIVGTWNAATNSPALSSGAGTQGSTYVVNTAGYTQLDGVGYWNVGDELTFDGAATVWRKISGSGRIELTATLTLWVIGSVHGGSDTTTNGTTFGTGFATVQGCINAIYARYDTNLQTVLVQIYAPYGPYTAPISISQQVPGGGQIYLQGANGNAAITVTGSDALTVQFGANIQIANLTFSTITSGNCVNVNNGGRILAYGNITFSAGASGHIVSFSAGEYYATQAYTISGSAPYHAHVNTGGRLIWNAIVITLTGTPAFSNYFVGVGIVGMIYAIGTTFSGTATGLRYVVHYNGAVRANLNEAAALVYFPGDQPGQSYDGGVFDYLGAAPRRQTRLTSQSADFTLLIPAYGRLGAIVVQNANGNAVTGGINIGTTAGAADIVAAFAVGANSFQDVPAASILKNLFSVSAVQTIYISAVGSWNSASVTLTLLYDDILNP